MRMRINRDNYEAWLLDLFEGRLRDDEREQLEEFARANPDLEVDLAQCNLPSLETVGEKFETPELLKRDSVDSLALSYVEGLMGETDRAAFEARMHGDPGLASLVKSYAITKLEHGSVEYPRKADLKKQEASELVIRFEKAIDSGTDNMMPVDLDDRARADWRLLQKTRLVAERDIVFAPKESLKRRPAIIPLFSRPNVLRVAASFAAVVILALILRTINNVQPFQPRIVASDRETPAGVPEAMQQTQASPVLNIEKQQVQRTRGRSRSNNFHRPQVRRVSVVQPHVVAVPAVTFPMTENAAGNESVTPVIASHTSIAVAAVSVPAAKELIHADELPLVEEKQEQQRVSATFWQRLANLAGDANRLGITAVDGKAEGDRGFRLSIFSYEIERH